MDWLVEDIGVAGNHDVATCRQRKPQIIIRTVSAYTAPCRRMPPVLNIALRELARSTAQKVLSHQLRRSVDKRHHVLQLIAKAERTARLIERVTRPQPTRENLVHEPTIG